MSSRRDPKGHFKFSLRISGWFLLVFALTAVGLYYASLEVVRSALEDEWNLTHSAVTGTVTDTGDVEDVRVTAVETRGVPTPQVKAAVERQLREIFPLLMLPMILIGLGGGLYLTYRAARRVRVIVRGVQDILETGEFHRRVPLEGLSGSTREVAAVLNHALAKNENLITDLYESLDNVAHDLRTPMTRLRGTAELALSSDEGGAAAREALADCLEESDGVLAMLDTLMDLAEAGTGVMRLDLKDLSVTEVVASVVDIYELVAEEKRLEIETDVPGTLVVRADPGRLRQLLANLVDNALKYTEADGGAVRVGAEAEGESVAIRVSDHGRGIDPEDLPRIWDRLFRGDLSRHERGLGLGLSFVKAIAEAHGGSADVESEVGRGSVFTVRLPRGERV